jgi:microcystin-dependent protein
MGLEAANYISDLIETNPTGSDPASSSDDHHRLVKKVLKQTFPNLNSPITASPAMLNGAKVRQGAGPGQGGNELSFGWVSPRIRMSVDGFDVGSIATGDDVVEAAPPGLLGLFFHGSLPAGWLKANGAAVSRTTYARLFGVIGTGYGGGDGSTTFNLPDMRGLFPRALDDGRGIDPGRVLGIFQSSANIFHTHGTTEAPHAHGTTEAPHIHGASTAANGGHDHDSGWTRNGDTGGAGTGDGIGGVNFISNVAVSAAGTQRKTSAVSNHTHGVTVNSAATGLSVNGATTGLSINASGDSESRPSNMALMACIRY